MTINKYLSVALLAIITTANTWAGEPYDSVAADSVKTRADYPERLITEFPVIYADTAYTTPQYHVVIRAVWMSKRKNKCKVTSVHRDIPHRRNTYTKKIYTYDKLHHNTENKT